VSKAAPRSRSATRGGECFGLVTVELHDAARVELGCWLLPEGRGRGRATHALRLVSHWLLSRAGVARLELAASPGNAASQRVAELAGFQREGILRSYHDRTQSVVVRTRCASHCYRTTHVMRPSLGPPGSRAALLDELSAVLSRSGGKFTGPGQWSPYSVRVSQGRRSGTVVRRPWWACNRPMPWHPVTMQVGMGRQSLRSPYTQEGASGRLVGACAA
jgi:hypothetical protein